MFSGETVRSRDLMEGVDCVINDVAKTKIWHADYFGSSARLFYTPYNQTLILIQTGAHDFNLENAIVRLL